MVFIDFDKIVINHAHLRGFVSISKLSVNLLPLFTNVEKEIGMVDRAVCSKSICWKEGMVDVISELILDQEMSELGRIRASSSGNVACGAVRCSTFNFLELQSLINLLTT